jgi:hypothetical protein
MPVEEVAVQLVPVRVVWEEEAVVQMMQLRPHQEQLIQVAEAVAGLAHKLPVQAVLVLLSFAMQTHIQRQQVQLVLLQLLYPVVTEYINLQNPVQ